MKEDEYKKSEYAQPVNKIFSFCHVALVLGFFPNTAEKHKSYRYIK